MQKVDLKALIQLASKSAEGIFRSTGQLLPMWHAVNAYGQTMLVPQPDPDKDVSVALIKMLFKDEGVTHYVFIGEAWSLDARTSDPATIDAAARRGLEHHPDRREIIAFSAESRDGGAQTAHRFILRPEIGKPTLSPLVMDDMEGRKSEGRLVGLFAKGRS